VESTAGFGKFCDPNAGFTAAVVVAAVLPVPWAELLLEAGTEPKAVTGVAVAGVGVIAAPPPNRELLTAGAFAPNKEVAGPGIVVLGPPFLLEPKMLGSDFALFAFPSSSSGTYVSSLTFAPKTGAFPFKAENEIPESFFRSVEKLTPVEATWPNGDSVGVVVFA
jgi:hypothetical protein